MKVTKYGHSCLLIEEGEAKLLFDPGMFSEGVEEITGLTAILITHQHGDHVAFDKIKALQKNNSDVQIFSDHATVDVLAKEGIQSKGVKQGDSFEVAGVPVAVFGEWHAVIHPKLPNVPNVGYLVNRRLFHPGDAFTNPEEAVEILAFVAAAPFAKVSESVEQINAVRPKIAIPIHEKVSAVPEMLFSMIQGGLDEGIEFVALKDGESREF